MCEYSARQRRWLLLLLLLPLLRRISKRDGHGHEWRGNVVYEYCVAPGRVGAQIGKDVHEEASVAVDAQHALAERVHESHGALPEGAPIGQLVDQERPQRVADLVARVAERQVEARQDLSVQIVGAEYLIAIQLTSIVAAASAIGGRRQRERLAHHHEDEDDVDGREEGLLLPALVEQRPVGRAHPADHVARVEARHQRALLVHCWH